jgi:hypothetical protein
VTGPVLLNVKFSGPVMKGFNLGLGPPTSNSYSLWNLDKLTYIIGLYFPLIFVFFDSPL